MERLKFSSQRKHQNNLLYYLVKLFSF